MKASVSYWRLMPWQVACGAIWFPLADEMKEIYSQFLQTLVNFGVPLKDASRSDE